MGRGRAYPQQYKGRVIAPAKILENEKTGKSSVAFTIAVDGLVKDGGEYKSATISCYYTPFKSKPQDDYRVNALCWISTKENRVEIAGLSYNSVDVIVSGFPRFTPAKTQNGASAYGYQIQLTNVSLDIIDDAVTEATINTMKQMDLGDFSDRNGQPTASQVQVIAPGPQATAPAAAPQPQFTPGQTFLVNGTTYRFKGGDPNSAENYEPLQATPTAVPTTAPVAPAATPAPVAPAATPAPVAAPVSPPVAVPVSSPAAAPVANTVGGNIKEMTLEELHGGGSPAQGNPLAVPKNVEDLLNSTGNENPLAGIASQLQN